MLFDALCRIIDNLHDMGILFLEKDMDIRFYKHTNRTFAFDTVKKKAKIRNRYYPEPFTGYGYLIT